MKMLAVFALLFVILLPLSAALGGSSTSPDILPHATPAISPTVSPDFSLSASPSSIVTTAGSTKTVQIIVTSLNGFVGTVYMDAFAFGSTGLNPPFVTLTSGGTASSTLTFTVPSYVPPGDYPAILEATGGCALFQELSISVTVTGPHFTIAAEKTQMTLAQGGSDTSKIDLASVSGFSGMISLSADNLMTSFSSPTVTLSPAGTGSSILTITAPATTDPGDYIVTVGGFSVSGGAYLSNSTDIHVTVTGPTFVLSATRYLLTLVAGGSSNTTTISVTPSGLFTGTVALASSPSTDVNPTLSASSVTVPPVGTSVLNVIAPSTTKAGLYSVDITGTSGTLSPSITIDVLVKQSDFGIFADPSFIAVVVNGGSCASTVSVSPVLGFSGSVSLALKGAASLTTSLSTNTVTVPGTSTLTISAPSGITPGIYDLEVNGTSSSPSRTHSASITVIVIGPDFTISANPDTITVLAGTTGTSTISLTSLLQFSGTVSLTSPPSLYSFTVAFSQPSITPSQTSTLSVTVPSTTFPGNYLVKVNGTSGHISHAIDVSIVVVVPGFILSASPSTLTVNTGSSQSSTITVVPTNGFSGSVDLFVSPPQNLNASIAPASVTSGSTATLSVNSTIPGSYSVDIFGSSPSASGYLFNDTSVTVTVVGPDFTVTPSPASLLETPGDSKTSTITLNTIGGFNKPVDLTATAPNGLTPTFAPTTITPPTTSLLTIAADPSIAPGSYTVDIQATSGLLVRTAQVTVNVIGFTLNANPDTLTILRGTSQTSTLTVAPENGFTGTVQLTTSLSPGITGTPSPSSIAGGSGTSSFGITAASTVAPGTYLENVTGTSGVLTQTVTITVTVPIPNFDISPSSPSTVQCVIGNACPETITITPQNGFTGTVSFTTSPGVGLLCNAIAPITVPAVTQASLSCHSITAGTFTVIVTGVSGTLSHPTALITYDVAVAPDFSVSAGSVTPATIFVGASGTSTISVSTAGGFSGAVGFQVSPSTPAGLTCATPATVNGPGTSTLTCSASTAGDYTVTITGSGTITGSIVTRTTGSILFHIVDFTISAGAVTPSPVLAKTAATSIVSVTDLNGFSDTVTFAVSASSPAGLTCTTPNIVYGTTLTSILSCDSSTPGDYTVIVTGTSGSLSHPTGNIVFHVSGFTVSASSPTASNTGQTATSTITITPVNGFTGTVSLSDTPASGLTCASLSQASIAITSTAATATLDCHSSQDGTFTATISAMSGSLTPQATATFTFHTPDIAITSTAPAAAKASEAATSTITVSPTYGFTSLVTLSVSAPSGITCTLDHSTLQGSGTASLSCTSNIPGDYTVTVTASGATQHTTSQTFHVSAAPSPAAPAPTILGLPPVAFYGLIGVLIAAVIGGIAVVIRRKAP